MLSECDEENNTFELENLIKNIEADGGEEFMECVETKYEVNQMHLNLDKANQEIMIRYQISKDLWI